LFPYTTLFRSRSNRKVADQSRCVPTAADPEVGVDVDTSELIVNHLEMASRDVDLDVAYGQLVGAEAAVHVERVPVAVLDVQRLHGDAIGRELQRRAHARVTRSGGRHRERGILDIHGAGEMRIGTGPDRVDVQLDVAAHVVNDVGDTFDKAQLDSAGFDGHVDRLLRQVAFEERQGYRAGRGDPCAGTLIETHVNRDRPVRIVNAARQL